MTSRDSAPGQAGTCPRHEQALVVGTTLTPGPTLTTEAIVAVFLFIVLVAVVLGIVGAVVKGLLYLLVIGIVIFLLNMMFAGWRLRGRRRVAP
jgi:hypothetical protein